MRNITWTNIFNLGFDTYGSRKYIDCKCLGLTVLLFNNVDLFWWEKQLEANFYAKKHILKVLVNNVPIQGLAYARHLVTQNKN